MDCNSAVMCKVLDTRTGIVSQIPPGILGQKVQGDESDYNWLPNFRMILGGTKVEGNQVDLTLYCWDSDYENNEGRITATVSSEVDCPSS